MREFYGYDNNGNPKQQYIDKIVAMTDEKLLKETEDKIWLSAFAANNPRSDYHWHVDVCYDAWKDRGDIDQYEVAWKKAAVTG